MSMDSLPVAPPKTRKKWDTLNARIDKIVERARKEGTLGDEVGYVNSSLQMSDLLLGGGGRVAARRG